MAPGIRRALLTLLPSASLAGHARPDARPKLTLKVSTHHGISPLDVKLEGAIEGVDPGLGAECFIRVDRKNDTSVTAPKPWWAETLRT